MVDSTEDELRVKIIDNAVEDKYYAIAFMLMIIGDRLTFIEKLLDHFIYSSGETPSTLDIIMRRKGKGEA